MKRILLSLSFGVIVSFGLFGFIFALDMLTAERGTGIVLMERTPFAWTFFWTFAFMPLVTSFEIIFPTALISNILLYGGMNYVVKTRRIRLV